MLNLFKWTLLALATSIVFLGCNQDDDQSGLVEIEELYFGTYYGMCGGNCTTIFWLRENEVLRDTVSDFYFNLVYQDPTVYEILSADDFAAAAGLIELFPEALYDQPEMIGIPDAYDQGGYFIAIPDTEAPNGFRQWRIDTNHEAVPEVLHDFLEGVFDRMELLND